MSRNYTIITDAKPWVGIQLPFCRQYFPTLSLVFYLGNKYSNSSNTLVGRGQRRKSKWLKSE